VETRKIILKAGVWAGHSVDRSRFFALVDVSENVSVKLSKDSNGNGGEIAEDRGAGYKEIAKTDEGRFGRVDFLSPIDQEIVYGVSERDIVDDTIFGEVQIKGIVKVDPLAAKESPAYSRYRSVESEAGSYAHFGVVNPAGSGKKIILWQLQVSSASVSGAFVRVQRETGEAEAKAVGSYSEMDIVSHDKDSAVSSAKLFTFRHVSAMEGDSILYVRDASNDFSFRPNRPVVLEEGDTVYVQIGLPNVNGYLTVEVEEIDSV